MPPLEKRFLKNETRSEPTVVDQLRIGKQFNPLNRTTTYEPNEMDANRLRISATIEIRRIDRGYRFSSTPGISTPATKKIPLFPSSLHYIGFPILVKPGAILSTPKYNERNNKAVGDSIRAAFSRRSLSMERGKRPPGTGWNGDAEGISEANERENLNQAKSGPIPERNAREWIGNRKEWKRKRRAGGRNPPARREGDAKSPRKQALPRLTEHRPRWTSPLPPASAFRDRSPGHPPSRRPGPIHS